MRNETATLAAVFMLAVAGSSTTARAAPSARLVYSRGHGAESCPDEAALRVAVATRVGYDPFFPWAKQTIVIAVSPARSGGFTANVSLVDELGVDHGTRTLRTPGVCRELIDTAALAIAIAIDPRSLLPRPPASDPPAPTPAVEAAPTSASVPRSESNPELASEAPPRRAVSIAFEGTAGVVGSVGVGPLPSLGGAIGFAFRWTHVSLGLEGRIDAPTTAGALGGGRVSTELVVATLLPCMHFGRVFACMVGQIGDLGDASESVVDSTSGRTLWLAAGGRLGVEVPLQSTLGLRVRSEVTADLRPRTFLVYQRSDWTAPLVSGSLGADAVVHF